MRKLQEQLAKALDLRARERGSRDEESMRELARRRGKENAGRSFNAPTSSDDLSRRMGKDLERREESASRGAAAEGGTGFWDNTMFTT